MTLRWPSSRRSPTRGWPLADTANGNQLLIGLDRTGTWFRYHHLLRDLLRLEAQRDLPERLADLHGRAAGWYEAQGDHGEADRQRGRFVAHPRTRYLGGTRAHP